MALASFCKLTDDFLFPRVRTVFQKFLFILAFAVFTLSSIAQASDTSAQLANAGAEEKAWADNLKHRAEQGDAEAQFNLSQTYQDGHIFQQSWPECIKWLRASAEQGYPMAQANLGALYSLGKGVTRDLSQALYWTQKAADEGDVRGEYNLGYMYAAGQGVKKNNSAAVQWYLKAALQGHQVAAYDVGIAYWYGMGIAQDQVEGYMWLLLAWRFGWAPSKKALDSLGATIDGEKLAAARRKADEWVRAHPKVKPVAL
jgi:hypothetical protein